MKKVMFLWAVLVAAFNMAVAQGNKSTLRVRLSDGSPLLVTINGRDFKKIGRSLTIADIPRKRQNIQVYKWRPYANGGGGKAELTYSGTIKIEKGSINDCIVDVAKHKLRLFKVATLQPLPPAPQPSPQRDRPLADADNAPVNEDITLAMPPDRSVSPKLAALKNTMDAVDADSKKLAEARKFVAANPVTSADVKAIAGWIFFDDNRLAFVKSSYGRVSDKANFAAVADVFTLDDSRKSFNDFLRGK
ncbi:MAG: DUF4476 domain-containing protein [Edaphocola sp.]